MPSVNPSTPSEYGSSNFLYAISVHGRCDACRVGLSDHLRRAGADSADQEGGDVEALPYLEVTPEKDRDLGIEAHRFVRRIHGRKLTAAAVAWSCTILACLILGGYVHAHPVHLVRVFSREFGISPHRYLTGRRIDFARRLLLDGMAPGLVAVAAGFYDQPHLSRHFRRALGISPVRYARSGP